MLQLFLKQASECLCDSEGQQYNSINTSSKHLHRLNGTYQVPGTVLSTLHVLTNLINKLTLWIPNREAVKSRFKLKEVWL